MIQNTALTLRTIAGLTQGQAADLIGAGARTWRSWENDEPPMPHKKAQAFRDAFKSQAQPMPTSQTEYEFGIPPEGEDPAITAAYEALCRKGRDSKLPDVFFHKPLPQRPPEELGIPPEPEEPPTDETPIEAQPATPSELEALAEEITNLRARELSQAS